MEKELEGKFKEAVENCLLIVKPLTEKCKAPFLTWRRGEWCSWESEWVDQADIPQILLVAEPELRAATRVFSDSFSARYSDYSQTVWIGGAGRSYSGTDLVRSGLEYLWQKHESFCVEPSAIDQMVDEFVAIIDSPEVNFTCEAQLANFDMALNSIDLPEGSTIRRLSDKEVTAFCGGSMTELAFPNHGDIGGLHEFCIETEAKEIKRFANFTGAGTEGLLEVKNKFAKVILALRTYQEGEVGYGRVRCCSTTFCPLLPQSYGWGDAYVPFGRYLLEPEDIGNFLDHAKQLFQSSEPSMNMACSRLADSSIRSNVKDRLVDAVVGMESLLLAGLRPEDRRGELRYRFALHYSSTFDSPSERYEAFRFAKDIYDLRSAVAHGGNLTGKQNDGLIDMAMRATEALRRLIHKFLPLAPQTPYRDFQFWELRYFGISDPS